jgi:TonB family protein
LPPAQVRAKLALGALSVGQNAAPEVRSMHETHVRARTTSLRLPRSWRFHVVVVAVIAICHGALFYGIAHMRTPRTSNANGPPMFGPIVSKVWVRRSVTISSKPWWPDAEKPLTPPPHHWKFPPIDLWPSAPTSSATLSAFTPVTDARPDPPDTRTPLQHGRLASKSAPGRSNLQMARWFRPVYYPIECTLPGLQGSVVLDLLIDPNGRPVEIKVAQSSGSLQLDGAALHAAGLWRFAPPLWKSQPVEVWGRIELRFNC